MGQKSGVVVVLPLASDAFEKACAALIPILQPGVEKPGWEIKSRSHDGCRILVDPESTQFFSMLTWTSEPPGFAWITLGFDTNDLFSGDDSVHAILESYLGTALTNLAAPFGYLTNYEHHLDDHWVKSRVLEPLSRRHFEQLADSSYDLLLLSKTLLDAISLDPVWRLQRETSEGALLRR